MISGEHSRPAAQVYLLGLALRGTPRALDLPRSS